MMFSSSILVLAMVLCCQVPSNLPLLLPLAIGGALLMMLQVFKQDG